MPGTTSALAGRLVAALVLALLLASCGHKQVRPDARAPQSVPRALVGDGWRKAPAAAAINPCAPTRVHRDSDYTPGGLYAPDVADSGPSAAIDVSNVREPVPRREPRARTGNRSPYTVLGKNYRVLDSSAGFHERGLASWYGTKFNGRATSSGELYDICSFTAAHKTLPLPSYVRVTNLDNGRSLIVRVNDRGPFHDGRVMDLSYAAAVRLGVDRTGTARVDLQAIDVDGEDRPAAVRSGNDYSTVPANQEGAAIIQVGSFGDEGNARRLVDRLAAAGLPGARAEPVDADDRTVWRVRIGPIGNDAVDATLDQLREMNLPGARVLRR